MNTNTLQSFNYFTVFRTSEHSKQSVISTTKSGADRGLIFDSILVDFGHVWIQTGGDRGSGPPPPEKSQKYMVF